VIDMRDVSMSEQAGELMEVLGEYGYDLKSDDHCILQSVSFINRTDIIHRIDDGFNLPVGETGESTHLLNNVAAMGDLDLWSRGEPMLHEVWPCTLLLGVETWTNPERWLVIS
jgi:hypothetical protein